MKKENCYYVEYGVCTCQYSKYCKKSCPEELCAHFLTETEYFTKSMDGTLKEGRTEEEVKEAFERRMKALERDKSKKQKKREEKIEAEKNKITETGFSLGDDPAFKDLFKNLKK